MSSFIAEVKSDLMGEQTILCGMLQTGSILCSTKWLKKHRRRLRVSSNPIRLGNSDRSIEIRRVTNMLDRLSNPAKIKAFDLSEELKLIMRPLYNQAPKTTSSAATSHKL